MKKFENIKNHIKATITKIKNYIKEKYNSNNTYKIIALCLFILNILMSILLICSISATNNLTKQLNDISKQNTSVTQTSSTNTSSDIKLDTDNKKTSSIISSSSTTSTTSTTTSTTSTTSKKTTSTTSKKDDSTTIKTGTTTDLDLLACVMYQEAGGSCEDCLRRVGDVVLNRVNDSRFPNTIRGVLTAKNQYGRFYYTGIKWPSRAKNYYEQKYVARAYRVAEEILNGQHSELYGKGYVWQAAFKQGSSQIKCCGEYFGK